MAPIIVFAFNRLESLKNTIDSVLRNPEASESELFVKFFLGFHGVCSFLCRMCTPAAADAKVSDARFL